MLAAALVVVAVHARAPAPPTGEVMLKIPPGTSFQAVVHTLAEREVITRSFLFRIYGRVRGLDRSMKAGTYRLPRGASFGEVHAAL